MNTGNEIRDARSRLRLKGVHPDLVRIIERAAKDAGITFIVTEGLRTMERQKELVKAGASKTLKSRHLTGHAVDLAVVVGKEIRWDWPLYEALAVQVKKAALAEKLELALEWGGSWKFKDGPHYQLTWKAYP